MDNSNIDKFTKDIMANSKVELVNPDFDKMVMNAIVSESRKKARIHQFLWYILVFISFDVILFSLLTLLNISIADITSKISELPHGGVHNLLKNSSHFLLIYALFLIVIILSVNRISNVKYRFK